MQQRGRGGGGRGVATYHTPSIPKSRGRLAPRQIAVASTPRFSASLEETEKRTPGPSRGNKQEILRRPGVFSARSTARTREKRGNSQSWSCDIGSYHAITYVIFSSEFGGQRQRRERIQRLCDDLETAATITIHYHDPLPPPPPPDSEGPSIGRRGFVRFRSRGRRSRQSSPFTSPPQTRRLSHQREGKYQRWLGGGGSSDNNRRGKEKSDARGGWEGRRKRGERFGEG